MSGPRMPRWQMSKYQMPEARARKFAASFARLHSFSFCAAHGPSRDGASLISPSLSLFARALVLPLLLPPPPTPSASLPLPLPPPPPLQPRMGQRSETRVLKRMSVYQGCIPVCHCQVQVPIAATMHPARRAAGVQVESRAPWRSCDSTRVERLVTLPG